MFSRLPVLRVTFLILSLLFLSAASKSQSVSPNSSHSDADEHSEHATGSEACASCHRETYDSYMKTVMARASGNASDAAITGEFEHKESGVHYKVFKRDDGVWMSYERTGENAIHGQVGLLYFIGSGVKGRTYLFSVDKFLFEAPINWYSQDGRWNMTPAYMDAREIPMNLPALVDCLNCHTSGMQAPIAGTDSEFNSKPFLHDGITCQRCHGSGEGHVQGKGAIVNPVKLTPERRDAICMECHFEGTAAVMQAGRQLYRFQPGEELSDYIHYFLLSKDQAQAPEALSQTEALAMSVCKKKSGDKMWCGSCHDPHREPAPAEKVAYYRGKCLNCHGDAFAAKHHVDRPDCRECHMRALPSKDVAHTEATDHRILRNPGLAQTTDVAPGVGLRAFPANTSVSTRDLALAWENLAQRGIEGANVEAEQFLRKAVKEYPNDAALLAAQGYVEQEHGHNKEAREFYEAALRNDPLDNEAATNLGTLEAQSGNLRRAVELWESAFARVPNRSAIGMNLAMIFCASGKNSEARESLQRVLQFNPDYGKAKELLNNLEKDPPQCRP